MRLVSVCFGLAIAALLSSCMFDISHYETRDGKIYYIEQQSDMGMPGGEIAKPIQADAATFRTLGNKPPLMWYGKDKDNVYCADRIIPGADPASFRLLDDPENDWYYFADDNSVYYRDKLIPGVKPEDVDVLSSQKFRAGGVCYFKDYSVSNPDLCDL